MLRYTKDIFTHKMYFIQTTPGLMSLFVIFQIENPRYLRQKPLPVSLVSNDLTGLFLGTGIFK